MGGRLLICIFIILFINSVFTIEKFLEENTNIQYQECSQESESVSCKALNISKVTRQYPSLWPPGPYAIPMSTIGCPETESHGWIKSVLHIRPARKETKRKKKITLDFCVKVRNDTDLDTESWIPGHYSIYMIGTKCPTGFKERTRRVSYYEYDSYGTIPNITEIGLSSKMKLKIMMCKKIFKKSDNKNKTSDYKTFRMYETSFDLIKKKTTECPKNTKFIRQGYCSFRTEDIFGDLNGFSLPMTQFNVSYHRVLKEDGGHWFHIDLRRSMKIDRIEATSMFEIRMLECLNSEMSFLTFDKTLKCYYDDILDYLRVEQTSMPWRINVYLKSPVRSRYFFLEFKVLRTNPKKLQLINNITFRIYSRNLNFLDGYLCNEDLGMTDGSIQNDQIFASSFSKLHPPFSARPSSRNPGWCSGKEIVDNFWIMVDLKSITKIEGFTLFPVLEEEHTQSNANWGSFHLLYGNNTNNLSIYDVKFATYFKAAARHQQSYFLQNPVSARFFKLQLNESLKGGPTCLRFEIQGCKLSDSKELFPSFIKSNGTTTSITTNALYIQKASVIMSIGYPSLTGCAYIYTWIIDFNQHHYVRLIFTNVTMNHMEEDRYTDCDDILVIGTNLLERKKGIHINKSFNKRVFIVETSKALVVVTFHSCFYQFRGSKFRAVVSKEDTPACFSIEPNVNWGKGRVETCTEPAMILTSMSILNIPFENFEERFRIQAPRHNSIQIEFLYFYIVCPTETSEFRSQFTVSERYTDSEYCNTDNPPKIIKSEENRIIIVFRRYNDPNKKFPAREGFRLHYNIFSYSLKKWTDRKHFLNTDDMFLSDGLQASNIAKVCSRKFKKCYSIFSLSISWYDARSVCWNLNQHLVTIQSRNELRYIHYLLRDQRYYDEKDEKIDAEELGFEAHIGLLRTMKKCKKNRFRWLKNFEVIFSAWAAGQPSAGDCAKTYFLSFDKNRTWESEDCNSERADYFVCQADYNEERKMEQNLKTTYEGKCMSLSYSNQHRLNHSYSGKACQYWIDYGVMQKEDNLCTVSLGLDILGCFVNDTVISWEPCFLPQPDNNFETPENFGAKYKCESTGRLIPLVNKCDKTFHCEDRSDEKNCTLNEHDLVRDLQLYPTDVPEWLIKGFTYQCGSNEWISAAAKCDTVIDCLDASDEIDCKRNNTGCNGDEFACDDGSCIKLGQVCDFKSDCTNAEDEFCELRNCGPNEYICDNKQCINHTKSCDAYPDCVDASDEVGCSSCRDSFHCDVERCVRNILVCDKVRDCEDGSDESDCTTDDVSSCKDLWERGYHESGQYLINGVKVFCDYKLTERNSTGISMEIQNLDFSLEQSIVDSIYTSTSKKKNVALSRDRTFDLLFRESRFCTINVRSTCHLPEHAAFIYDRKYKLDFNISCPCFIQKLKIFNVFNIHGFGNVIHFFSNSFYPLYHRYGKYRYLQVSPCDKKGTTESKPTFYTISEIVDSKSTRREEVPTNIKIDKISCSYDYSLTLNEDQYECQGENTTIHTSQVCLYDEDESGYMKGCRSGMHLQICDEFECPGNTVKCPHSYCISLRFVCDGKIQCPGGEDEYNCSCESTNRDVVFFIEDAKQQTDSRGAVESLAKQFTSGNSEVRLLYFKGEQRLNGFPLIHRILEIREKHITNRADEIVSDCTYKTMAQNLLPSLQFSDKETKAVIFIEDSIESSIVAKIMFSNISRQEFTMHRVIKNFSYSGNIKGIYNNVIDVRVNKWDSLRAVGYRLFPEICKEASYVPCAGGFRCSSSKQCIPMSQVCDGVNQCLNNDDEYMCDFRCLSRCKCGHGLVECRDTNMTILEIGFLSRKTRSADLSHNTRLKDVLSKENLHFPFMLNLDVSYCNIEVLSKMAFSNTNNLLKLNLSYNIIKKLTDNVFKDLRHLVEIDLDGNFDLTEISSSAFQGLKSIKALRISGTKLKKISSLTFANLKLERIDLSNNDIREIENYAFSNTLVKKINFEGNKIIKFHQYIFKNILSLQELRTPAYKFCCIRPSYVKEENCYPPKNEFSSCDDLMRHPVLQALLWLVGLASLLGNLGSIFYRILYDRQRLKIGYGIFVTNLASADLLMGIYLIVIACVDSIYRNRYIYMDDQWRNSVWCTLAGFLSTVSSEASVFFLCLITIDRLLVIKYPFGHVRFTPRTAYICCCICWTIAIFLAAIPIFHTSYFKNKFYSRSGVCIALPLSRDKPPGWMYSVSIFVGLNFGTFILVAFGQLSIFLELRKSRAGGKKTQKSRKRDLQVARNLILVATTDFLCWFPIGCMGIMSLNGYTISGDVYAWTAVFILPFNSALNPFLYTLSAIIGKKAFNPSIEEQSRTEIEREKGSAILQYTGNSVLVRTKQEIVTCGKTRRIKEILDGDENMSVAKLTAISYQLAYYLRVLHDSSIGIESLSETNTYIQSTNKKIKTPMLVLDTKRTLVKDEQKKADNIYHYGCLLRKMIAKCETKR